VVPTFVAKCLYVRKDDKRQNAERFVEILSRYFEEMTASSPFIYVSCNKSRTMIEEIRVLAIELQYILAEIDRELWFEPT